MSSKRPDNSKPPGTGGRRRRTEINNATVLTVCFCWRAYYFLRLFVARSFRSVRFAGHRHATNKNVRLNRIGRCTYLVAHENKITKIMIQRTHIVTIFLPEGHCYWTNELRIWAICGTIVFKNLINI